MHCCHYCALLARRVPMTNHAAADLPERFIIRKQIWNFASARIADLHLTS
jgi:hypothetical protein